MDLASSPLTTRDRRDTWLDKPVFPWWPAFTIQILLIVLILGLTVFTRF